MPARQSMWHDVLDRTLISFSIWWLTCPHHRPRAANVRRASSPRTTSLGPLRSVRIGSARSSSGVCPECGTNVGKHVRTPTWTSAFLNAKSLGTAPRPPAFPPARQMRRQQLGPASIHQMACSAPRQRASAACDSFRASRCRIRGSGPALREGRSRRRRRTPPAFASDRTRWRDRV